MANNQFRIDARQFSKYLDGVKRRSEDGRTLKNIAKVAAKPWAKELKSEVYTRLDRRTGGLRRGITVRQLKNGIGVAAGANFKSKGGWKAHFFAPHQKVRTKIDYQSVYARRTREVLRKFREGIINFTLKT